MRSERERERGGGRRGEGDGAGGGLGLTVVQLSRQFWVMTDADWLDSGQQDEGV